MVKIGRNKRNIDDSEALVLGITSQVAPLKVLWKGTSTPPTDEPGNLTQFTGAYAFAAMNKVIEVKDLLRDNYENIANMKQEFINKEEQLRAHQLDQKEIALVES